MRAITPVLSLIMIIVIVVIVVGFSTGFFYSFISSLKQTAKTQLETQQEQVSKCFFIEAAFHNYIYIRNCGDTPLNDFFVTTNGTQLPLVNNVTIQPKSVGRIMINVSSIQEGVHNIVVSAGSLSRSISFYVAQSEPAKPVISNVVVNISTSEATISWTTSIPCSHTLEWGSSESYEYSVTNENYISSHSETITGLSGLTTYYYRINCTDENKNKASYQSSFTIGCNDDSDCQGVILDHVECNGTNLYDVYYNYTCQSNACVGEFLNRTFKQHCEFSCFSGECKTPGTMEHSTAQFPCQDPVLSDLKNDFDNIESSLNYYNYSDSSRLSDSAISWLGWSQTDAMKGYAEMYKATHDIYYLKKLIINADRIISWKNDNYRDEQHPYGLRDYKGDILKTWTFNQSSSQFLQVTYTQTTGTITYPMLDFAKIVYDNPDLQNIVLYDGMTMKQKADYYIQIAKQAVAEHDAEWQENGNEGYYIIYDPDPLGGKCNSGELTSCFAWNLSYVNEDEGYYICPENTAPIPYERSCVPINQQSLIMKSIIRLYELTGEQQYWDKMQKYSNFLKNRFEYDADNDLYLIKHNCDGVEPGLFSGWDDLTRCPQTQAALPGNEELSYFGIIVETAGMLNEDNAGITDTDMQRLTNTFIKNIYKQDEEYLAHIVNGAGTDIRAVPGLFRLVPFNNSIYDMLKNFYVIGDGNPYCDDPNYYGSPCYYTQSSSLAGYARSISYCNYSAMSI